MKKLFFILFFSLSIVLIANAQNVVTSNYGSYSSPSLVQESSVGHNNQSDTRIRDFTFNISTKADIYGVTMGFANEDGLGYGVIGASVSTGDSKQFSLSFGYGLDLRNTGDVFMFTVNLYPYAGIMNYDTINDKNEKVNKWKFNYGLSGGVKLGLNVYTSATGAKHYITVGYGIGAPEFETHNMIKNGQWNLGLTIVY